MKKYIIICLTIIVLGLGADYLYYYNGALFFPYTGQSTCFTGADNESLYLDTGDGLEVLTSGASISAWASQGILPRIMQ